MAFKIVKNDQDISYGVKELVCDTAEDIKNLPVCAMGSICLVIATGEVYMINSEKEWVKL